MADILKPVIKKLRQEEARLERELKRVGKVLRSLLSLGGGLSGSRKSGRKKTRKHSAKSRAAIARSKRAWWKERRKLLKAQKTA